MIDSELFKKLQFTQGDSQKDKSSSWHRKLDAIEAYLKTMLFQDNASHGAFVTLGEETSLRFALIFDAVAFHEDQIRTTSCVLQLYRQLADATLQPIHTRESLDTLSDLHHQDNAWLETLAPYFFTHTDNILCILLPALKEVEILKALCVEQRLFYFDPEPKQYAWVAASQPAHFKLALQEVDEGWKLWGSLIDVQDNSTDLWDIQAVTTGGVARRDQQLFEYMPSAYPWIETLVSGGAIRCPKEALQALLYRLLGLFDQASIDWPMNMKVTTAVTPVQPIFYVKTQEDKKKFKTKIEGFVWFRAENLEYPDVIHKNANVPQRPKVLRVQVNSHIIQDQWQYLVSVQVPDSNAENTRLHEIEQCAGVDWDESRRSFFIALSQTTQIFYNLLGRGWEVWAENLQVKILQEMEIQMTTDSNWFEMNVTAGKSASKISAWQLIHMLKKKRMFIQLDDGTLGLLPERWYQEFEQLFALRFPDVSESEESLRFSKAHAFHFANMAEMADNAEGVHFKGDAGFEHIRHEIMNINGLKPMQPASTFRLTLRHYQEIGLSWLHFLGRAHLGGCLADDMGLGKTVQVLAYLDLKRFELQKGSKFKSLLVCPRSLLEHWHQEAKKCVPRLKVFILRSVDIPHLESLIEHYDLLLISYGLVRQHVQKLQQYPFDFLALDEAQLVKNQSAQITLAVNQLQGIQRLAISGTPVENHMGEFFSLFEFLNPGLTHPTLLKTLGVQCQEDAESSSVATQFLKGLRPLILRRLKSEVAKELPPKLEQVLILPMVEQQEAVYTSLKNYYQEQLKNQTADLFYEKSFFLEGLLRLRQAACHPLLFEDSLLSQHGDYTEYASNKFEFLTDKLKTLVSSNHKAIVFSQFTSLLKLFRNILDTLEISYEYLDGQSQHRMDIVTRFQENQEIPILLAGIKTGGLGLNLTAADYCFILDPWWNPAIEKQAVDRIHRIGQTKTVNIYRIVSQDTVEEKMLLLKEKKQKIADQIITADHAFLEQLNYEDFQFLFQ